MDRELRNIESLRPKMRIIWFLTIQDIVFIVLITAAFWAIRKVAFPPLQEVFWVGTGIQLLFLLKPPKSNPDKSHLLMMYLTLRRFITGQYKWYRSIDSHDFQDKEDKHL
ncbi:hypothetical protein [Enterococcus sp. 5B3_DIV0040]|uniref:hypothetical protein n=1 Tax=Enterococcus sp. 5B3_DIV0040 TaxID=1834182 RepID=UPI000A35AA63|nr:hypothetical protein [Enterococcus sp. 5B3_DIV0040]OTO03235.1 hypothetical protein A5883_000200 [Enterococcus sp. 5B3_DIV0040]